MDKKDKAIKFDSFKLSSPTLKGLKEAGYIETTPIQSLSLKHTLEGKDVLGAARTGSGKTLAFLVPLIESLFKQKWCPIYGLGAIVISPTRELALQIFEVLKKIGKYHNFSAGAITGGKDLKHEWKLVDKCNILVCTPGRLLHHMDGNSRFNSDNIKFVVLDEADRILEEGFAKQVNAIIANLPADRQTLLFSATQTRDVKDLARLSLKNPVFIDGDVNKDETVSKDKFGKVVMPKNLVQSYVVIDLSEKLNFLWSFIQSHRNHKSLVFMSTCKQVKFAYELFKNLDMTLRRGKLLSLYGSLHQQQRITVYESFCTPSPKTLMATDIASRGLDFPDVQTVIQLDCPEDVNTYIHRAGRTARYTKGGHSLLVLLPSEAPSFLEQLKKRGIEVNELEINPRKQQTMNRKAEASLAAHVELKETAQRAFKAYFKNIYLMKDKSVFNVNELDKESFAKSMGLTNTPRIRFLEKKTKNRKASVKVVEEHSDDDIAKDDENDADDDLFTVKSTWKPDDDEPSLIPENLPSIEELKSTKKSSKLVTKAASAKKILKKQIKANNHIVFNEDGEAKEEEVPSKQTSEKLKLLQQRTESGIDIELAKEIMKDEDIIDKQFHKKLLRQKRVEKKRKLKEEEMDDRNKKRRLALLGQDEVEDGEHAEADDDSDSGDDVGTSKFIDDLPDPDKYYGNKEINSDDEDDNGHFRRKLAPPSSEEDSDEDDDYGQEESNDDDGNEDTEQLAIHLLKNKC